MGGGLDKEGVLFGTSASQADWAKGNDGAMRPLLPVMVDPLLSGKRITSIACEKTSSSYLPLVIIIASVCAHMILCLCVCLC